MASDSGGGTEFPPILEVVNIEEIKHLIKNSNIKQESKSLIIESFERLINENKSLNHQLKSIKSYGEFNKLDNKPEIETLIIESTDGKHGSAFIEDEIDKHLNPVKNGYRIKNRKKGKEGKYIIKAEKVSADMIETQMKSMFKEEDGFKIRKPKEKVPFILIKNVDKKLKSKDEIVEAIYSQNSDLLDREKDEIKVVFEFGRAEAPLKNVVIDPGNCHTRKKLLKRHMIYLGDMVSYAINYISVMFCRNCCEYGHKHRPNHSTKCCKNKSKCLYCNGEHFHEQCPSKDKSEEHKCHNCIHSNDRNAKFKKKKPYDFKHRADDKNRCSVYKDKYDQQIKFIKQYDREH